MKAVKTAAVALAAAALTCTGLAGAYGQDVQDIGSAPAGYTPWLLAGTPNQMVRQLVDCDGTMYAVGTISAIGQGDDTYSRGNAFSFSAATGLLTSWDPQVNGTVNSIALSPDCSTAYLGGTFTQAEGVSVNNLVAVSTATGDVVTGFASNANAEVDTLVYAHDMLLVGGTFSSINGVAQAKLASLDPATGTPTSYAGLSITGSYPPQSWTRIYNSQLSHNGKRLLVEGVFTSIGGKARQQIAILDFGPNGLKVDAWHSTEFNRACSPNVPFYVRAAAWSPNDKRVYVADTGVRPAKGPGSKQAGFPLTGLCDAAAAFPSTRGAVHHIWINYTGCDSYYSVAATANTVYVSGHERWASNPNACDRAGRGAVSRPGIAALRAKNGKPTPWNPTRSLGHGTDDMIITSEGLWLASDNYTDGLAQYCGGVGNKGGICLFPDGS